MSSSSHLVQCHSPIQPRTSRFLGVRILFVDPCWNSLNGTSARRKVSTHTESMEMWLDSNRETYSPNCWRQCTTWDKAPSVMSIPDITHPIYPFYINFLISFSPHLYHNSSRLNRFSCGTNSGYHSFSSAPSGKNRTNTWQNIRPLPQETNSCSP